MRNELSERTLPSRRTPGHHLRLVEGGRGPTVLFVHGASGSWRNWTPQLREFARTHRVVALNLRGHADSPWPGQGDVEDFFNDVLDVVDELPERFDLVAHSFGGCLATLLATRYPERVRSLTLVNTAGHIPHGLALKLLQVASPHANLLLRHNDRLISTNGIVSRHLVYHTLQQWNVWSLYPQVRCPAQMVLGQFDPLIPVDLGRRSARAIPGCRLRVLPVGGHVAMWEAPALLNTWLRELIDGVANSPCSLAV